MSKIITNPLTRRKITALFHVGMKDEDISDKLGIPLYKAKATRLDIGLKRTTAPKQKLTGGFDKTGLPTVKNNPSNSNAKVNQFAVIRAWLEQNGERNQSKLATRFCCTRAYVSKVIKKAKEGGLLNEDGTLFTVDSEEVAEAVLRGLSGDE